MASIVDSTCAMPQSRMLTGIDGFDQILCGGLIRGNSMLIQGPPGSAKTTLGIQTLVNGFARFGEKSVLLSLEQQPEQIIRDARVFGWDLASAHKRREIYLLCMKPQDLFRSLTGEDSGATAAVRQARESLGASRILVDSITHFYRAHQPIEERDRIFTEFLQALRQFEMTPLLIAELPSPSEAIHSHITYVADMVANTHYDYDARTGFRKRWIEIVKSRGQECVEGRHPIRFTEQGIHVYPRILPRTDSSIDPIGSKRICSTGVGGLDDLIGGGIAGGTLATVAGPEGTAKTTIGAHYLAAGCEAGESCVLVTFEESPEQLLGNMTSRGLDLAPYVRKKNLEILHLPPIGLCLLETYYKLERLIDERKVQRIVIDNVNDLLRNATDPQDEHYFLSLYASLFRHKGIATMLLEEIRPTTGLDSFAAVRHASTADTIILLGLTDAGGRLAKSIVVMKSRNAIADAYYHELVLTPHGAEVRPRMS